RTRYVQQAPSDYEEIARGRGDPVSAIDICRHILDPHQEAVLYRMHLEDRRYGPPGSGPDASDMVGNGCGGVETAPSQQLCAPRHVRIFAVGEEIRIKEAVFGRNIGNHFAPVQGCGGAGAEDVLGLRETVIVWLVPAAVEVPHSRSEVNACGVNSRLIRDCEIAPDAQQFAADHAYARIQIPSLDQTPDKARLHLDVGIQRKDPLAPAGGDRLVLSGGEAGIAIILNQADTVLVPGKDG